jgi:hypothetical protein
LIVSALVGVAVLPMLDRYYDGKELALVVCAVVVAFVVLGEVAARLRR